MDNGEALFVHLFIIHNRFSVCDVTIGGHYWTAGLGVDTADTDHRLCIGYGGNGGGRLLQIPCQVKSIKRGDNCPHFAPAATAAARSSVGISDCRNTTTQICFLCS